MEIKKGDKVTYLPKMEKGIVKGINKKGTIFVVYACDNNWENYENYTACGTDIKDLVIGLVSNYSQKIEETENA